jgi:aspartyl-tRNA(Asn)/glutamyl-tRNA(Gln) amidotransferase subunit B
MKFEPVIGLEIHVQLKTESKMFCPCSNRGEFEPANTTICPVCVGHPGTLPVINGKAVEFGVLVGLALGCRVNPRSKFDRKNYFYPDLPKGYQISQKDLPVAEQGSLSFTVKDAAGSPREVTVRINRAHLEEDAAKLLHSADGKASYVDYNRGGTPLIEIVTEPDLHSPAEAKSFLQELRLIMRYLGVSDADMEKGQMRCDANISLRQVVEYPANEPHALQFNPKTEVKNINSFRAVEHALEYEIKRQTKLWLDGKPPMEQSTRGWDDEKKVTVAQRTKEEAHDYRYFPEPDLPPLDLEPVMRSLEGGLPELPAARRARFKDEYGFSEADARIFCDDKDLAEYAEAVMSELKEWAASSGLDWGPKRQEFSKLVSGWLLSKLLGVMSESKIAMRDLKITAENFAELLLMIFEKKLTNVSALVVLTEMAATGADPSVIVNEKNLGQVDDSTELAEVARNIIASNPDAVSDWKKGKANAAQFLVGQMMKATKGKANPQMARELIEKELGK